MSTRYVWTKSTPTYVEKTRTVKLSVGVPSVLGTNSDYTMGYVADFAEPVRKDNKTDGEIIGWQCSFRKKLNGGLFISAGGPSSNSDTYFVAEDEDIVTRYAERKNKSDNCWWYGTYDTEYYYQTGHRRGAATLQPQNSQYEGMEKDSLEILEHYLEASGESTAKVSSNDRNAYSGSEYTYAGSDSIDPLSISYPTSGVKAGDRITVTLVAAPNSFGGTISYLYQYNTGSGWVTIQTTTSTSIQFTIPSDAKSIQFRARAQDDWGFISNDYVTGPTVLFGAGNIWVGVGNTARQATGVWVGVNGVAKKATAMWVGVNGVAKKVF